MSYCRWSSNNFRCDLYCYESEEGFMTHVASNRVVGDIPEASLDFLRDPNGSSSEVVMDRLTNYDAKWKKYIEDYKAQMKFLETAEREPIGLPYDGESYCDKTLEEFLQRLLHLRETGYIFPDYVLEAVREEMEEA